MHTMREQTSIRFVEIPCREARGQSNFILCLVLRCGVKRWLVTVMREVFLEDRRQRDAWYEKAEGLRKVGTRSGLPMYILMLFELAL